MYLLKRKLEELILCLISSLFSYIFIDFYFLQVLRESEMHPIRLLSQNAQLAAIVYFPFWLFNDAATMWSSWWSGDTVCLAIKMFVPYP